MFYFVFVYVSLIIIYFFNAKKYSRGKIFIGFCLSIISDGCRNKYVNLRELETTSTSPHSWWSGNTGRACRVADGGHRVFNYDTDY